MEPLRRRAVRCLWREILQRANRRVGDRGRAGLPCCERIIEPGLQGRRRRKAQERAVMDAEGVPDPAHLVRAARPEMR
jgi:hypothetical protein